MIISLHDVARMMMPVLVSAGLTTGVTAPAGADMIRSWQSGDRSAAAYTDSETKPFEQCRGQRTTDAGGSFGVAQVRNMNWVLCFTSPAPTSAGTPLQIAIQIDQGPRRLLNVPVTDHTVVQGGVANRSDLVEATQRGRSPAFDSLGGQYGATRVDGVSKLTAELSQCVQARASAGRGTTNQQAAQPASQASGPQFAAPQMTIAQATAPQVTVPQAAAPQAGATQAGTPQAAATPQSATPQAATAQTVAAQVAAAQIELAATRIASNLLLQAELPNARLLTPADTPVMLRGLGTAWTSDAGSGAVSVIQNAPGRDVQQVALGTIIAGANGCRGEFAAARSTSLVDDTLVTKAFTVCSNSAGTHSVRFFILHRETSWYVVYAIVPLASASNGGVEQASTPGPLQDSNFQAVAVKAALYQ